MSGFLKFVRKYVPNSMFTVNYDHNKSELTKLLKDLEPRLEQDNSLEYFHYLHKMGKNLHKERDDHHYIWIKNTSRIRPLIIECANIIFRSGYIDHVYDAFFLTLPEILTLIMEKGKSEIDKEFLSEQINSRIAHLTKMTGIQYHRSSVMEGMDIIDTAF